MKIHFIGIGGAGMLPLAIHSKLKGHRVSGSDLSSENFHILRNEGISPEKGHGQVEPGVELVVYSSAVKEDNPEFVSAKKQNIPIIKRAEFLGLITKESHAVLVSGSHGKSTTCTMLADMLNNYPGINATALVGAETVSMNSNYYKGRGDHIILEADEYDRSFLKLYPSDLIILNIDDDHMDIYGDMDGLKNCFRELISKLSENSILIFNGDDEAAAETAENFSRNKVSFGIINKCDYTAENIEFMKIFIRSST
jgi:UDP-N-acetylmuramate--alanine ligase